MDYLRFLLGSSNFAKYLLTNYVKADAMATIWQI